MTTSPRCLECVVNVSEGRDESVLAMLSASAGPALLDLHRDPHHHRTVLTLAGGPDDVAGAARSLARATVDRLDLRAHDGVHPRLGVRGHRTSWRSVIGASVAPSVLRTFSLFTAQYRPGFLRNS